MTHWTDPYADTACRDGLAEARRYETMQRAREYIDRLEDGDHIYASEENGVLLGAILALAGREHKKLRGGIVRDEPKDHGVYDEISGYECTRT